MHRFLIDPAAVRDGRAFLNESESRHALRVLRLSHGARVEAMDGLGEAWQGQLLIEGETACILLGEKLPSNEAPVRLTLYMGLPKGEKLELIAQKLCEMGAARLVPVRMERCVARIAANEAEKKLSRVRRIVQEAQKQSGRQNGMPVEDPIDWPVLLQRISKHERAFLLWENARGYRLTDARSEEENHLDIAAVVGPEGGISEKEAEALESVGARTVSLGPRILRAETAAIVTAAEILTLWGDL